MSWILGHIKKLPVVPLCLSATFVVSGLCINCIQLILYVALKPFNDRLFKKINYYLQYSICSQLLFIGEWWSGSDCRVHFADVHTTESLGRSTALCIMNHTYEVDWLMSMIIADRCGALGSCKSISKDILRYVPTLGWSTAFSSFVFLRRNWDDDKKNITKQLDVLDNYPCTFWLLLQCEGTRFTPSKHEISMEVARKKGLPELRNLLLPRTKGFVSSVSHLRNKLDFIYDITVCFDTDRYAWPTIANVLRGKKVQGEIYLRQIPISEVPQDAEEAAAWLHRLYRTKDKLMTSYLETGSFSQLSGMKEVPSRTLPRRMFSLLNMLIWMWLVFTPLACSVVGMLLSGSGLQTATGGLVIAALSFIMYKLAGYIVVSGTSSYGSRLQEVACSELVEGKKR